MLNLVHGSGEETGEHLASHPKIDGLSFTGSTVVGMRIAGQCAEAGKKVSCEMGGKNAIIVMEDADLNLAVEGTIWGGFGTSGQRGAPQPAASWCRRASISLSSAGS